MRGLALFVIFVLIARYICSTDACVCRIKMKQHTLESHCVQQGNYLNCQVLLVTFHQLASDINLRHATSNVFVRCDASLRAEGKHFQLLL